MGLFSWKCKRCGMPIACPYYLNGKNEWMNRAIVLNEYGSIIAAGDYDGYGRVESLVIADDPDVDPEMYHEVCFNTLGPTESRGPSQRDDSQGGFTKKLPDVSDPEELP